MDYPCTSTHNTVTLSVTLWLSPISNALASQSCDAERVANLTSDWLIECSGNVCDPQSHALVLLTNAAPVCSFAVLCCRCVQRG